MRRFHHLDLAAVGAVAVARYHQPGELAFPDRFDGFGHGGCRFACSNDDGPAAAVCRQMVGQHLARVRGIDGGGEQVAQEGLRFEVHVQLHLVGQVPDSRP